MRRLVLWDVDGTLVRTGGAGADVFVAAVQRALGVSAENHGVHMSGKTDPQIAREILATIAETAALGDEELDDAVTAVLGHLETELAAAIDRIRTEGRVLPGVVEILDSLHRHPDALQTLLTGNIAPNAMVKVSAFDLDRFFDWEVGAFGSDDHDRLRLVPLAVTKAADRHGHRFAPEEVWVVGDTPRDLACARAAGANCLLVGTGRYSTEELEAAIADHRNGARSARERAMPDLSHAAEVLSLLLD